MADQGFFYLFWCGGENGSLAQIFNITILYLLGWEAVTREHTVSNQLFPWNPSACYIDRNFSIIVEWKLPF